MWFADIKFGNNCSIGLHFYNREEIIEWFDIHLKEYIFMDNAYEIRIWFEENKK